MGKQDEAVTGTLCVVDLDAWVCNGSTPRSILAFKGLVYEETGIFHVLSALRQEQGNICDWAGGEIGLQCVFCCSLKSASCWVLKHILLSILLLKVYKLQLNYKCWVHNVLVSFTICVSINISILLYKNTQKHTNTHTLHGKLTPVSGCAVQANSVVAHFVSISVSVNGSRKKTSRSDKEEQSDRGDQ